LKHRFAIWVAADSHFFGHSQGIAIIEFKRLDALKVLFRLPLKLNKPNVETFVRRSERCPNHSNHWSKPRMLTDGYEEKHLLLVRKSEIGLNFSKTSDHVAVCYDNGGAHEKASANDLEVRLRCVLVVFLEGHR